MTIDPKNLHYLPSHEWVSVDENDGKSIATIGISAFAVEQLTDLVFMALPDVGTDVAAEAEFGEVESVKAVSPMYAPVGGKVIEAHSDLVDNLHILNEDPYTAGWIIKLEMSDPSEVSKLMDFDAYQKQCSEEG
jgi:glycine cleavage system H protein